MVSIRIARVEDVPTILGFIRDLAEYEKLLEQVVADEEALVASLFGARPAAEVLIADVDDVPVGFALFFQSYSTFLARRGLYLEDLFVRPAARGKGVGGALMAACAKVAVDRGYGRFEWSVLDWNEPALGFYKQLGATPVSGWNLQRMSGDPLAALAAKAPELAL
jgi:GNAT superfamily N-acetyltransferase